MEKRQLYFYYWGLLEGQEKEEVEAYLRQGNNQEEYSDLATKLDYLFPPADSLEYEQKIIPFQEIRRIYRKRLAKEKRRKGLIFFIISIGALLVAVVSSLYLCKLNPFGIFGKNTGSERDADAFFDEEDER